MPYAAATPIDGAPRTAIVRMASAVAARVRIFRTITRSGSSRWSRSDKVPREYQSARTGTSLLCVERVGQIEPIGGHDLRRAYGRVERDPLDDRTGQDGHLSEATGEGEIDRAGAEAGREDAIEQFRRTPPLDVSDLRAPRFDGGCFLDATGDLDSYFALAEELVTELVLPSGRAAPGSELDSFTRDDERIAPSGHRSPDLLHQERLVVGLLGKERRVGARREAGRERDPTCVATHDLEDDGPVMAGRRVTEAFESVDGDIDRRMET